MSTIFWIAVKPISIMITPKPRMMMPAGSPMTDTFWSNIGVEEGRSGQVDEAREAEGQQPDDVARQALLGRQGPDLALDPDAFADGEGDRVEDLGEVAADLVLDGDGGRHQLEVVGPDPPDHVLEGGVERQAQVHLADDPPELGRDRWP